MDVQDAINRSTIRRDLLLLALLLTLACAVFVAAEFSLTTVERGDLERAAATGERGAEGALKAVRKLTLQLSGAQLGITVTSLVIGMLAEPSLAVLLSGPIEAVGEISTDDFKGLNRALVRLERFWSDQIRFRL